MIWLLAQEKKKNLALNNMENKLLIDSRTLEIISQVVYKEHAARAPQTYFTNSTTKEIRKAFFSNVQEDVLELARTILSVDILVNHSPKKIK